MTTRGCPPLGVKVAETSYPHGRGVSIGKLACIPCDYEVDLGDEEGEASVRMDRFFKRHSHNADCLDRRG